MKRGRVLRLTLIGVAVSVVTALALMAGTAVVLVRRPLPDREGEVHLDGLTGEVSVQRGDAAVPDITAGSPADLFRAQGYVQAQERFYEMDVRRRVASGTLAELVGSRSEAVSSDVIARTLSFTRIAEAELPLLDPATREALEAYARGVNDYLRGRSPSQISLNYTLLGGGGDLPAIEQWTPVDSLAVLKYLAWDLAGNVKDELGRSLAFGAIDDADRVAQIYPPFPYAEHSPIVVGAGRASNSRLPARALPVAAPPLAAPPVAAPSNDDETSDAVAAPFGSGTSNDLPASTFKALKPVFESVDAALAILPDLVGGGEDLGSNAWAISGQFTASGKPLLANDPHLRASAPGAAMQLGLHCRTVDQDCPYDVSGFGIAGLPGVLSGHTRTSAWGIANLLADVADLYLERLGADGKSTLRDGRQTPMSTRDETIQVADEDAFTITVRTTDHGPLISDALDGAARAGRVARVGGQDRESNGGFGVAVAWTGSTPGTSMAGILGLSRAENFTEFRRSALKISAPALSLVYADAGSHLGYVAAAAVPVRPSVLPTEDVPADGTWPQPGWTSERDWVGVLRDRDLPWALDPAEGFVVAANQAVTRPVTGTPLSRDFDAGYRSDRIRDQLSSVVDSGRKVDAGQMAALQRDSVNGLAPVLVPVLLKATVDDFTQDAQRLLVGWDYTQDGDSAAAAYFNAVWAQLLTLTFSDELPKGIRADGGARWFEVVRRLLERPNDKWWDDRRTAGLGETRDGIIAAALTQARLSLTSKLGKDPSRWRWERLHPVELEQTPVTSTGNGLARSVVGLGPVEVGGGSSVVDAFAWDAAESFKVTTAPAYRMVVDLGELDKSQWIAQTGVSGHPFDSHYDDQVDDWATGALRSWPFSASAVQEASDGELTLTPSGG